MLNDVGALGSSSFATNAFICPKLHSHGPCTRTSTSCPVARQCPYSYENPMQQIKAAVADVFDFSVR
eukprot:scaffold122027_cov25-Prasinocladus_malaysianus.AAC.1